MTQKLISVMCFKLCIRCIVYLCDMKIHPVDMGKITDKCVSQKLYFQVYIKNVIACTLDNIVHNKHTLFKKSKTVQISNNNCM